MLNSDIIENTPGKGCQVGRKGRNGSVGLFGKGKRLDKTLIKGLLVLERIARSETAVRVTEVAADLGLTKSNAHRVLKTLEFAGYVKQDPRTKEFGPSMKLWELGSEIVGRLDLRSHAASALRRLAEHSQESAQLSILDACHVIYIDKVDGGNPVRISTRLGGRAPAYCVATGKALLSHLPPDELEPIIEDLKKQTAQTVTDRQKLLDELGEARRRGFAVSRGEWHEGIWGIASAVADASGNVVAAVGVSGPQFRYSQPGQIEKLGEIVRTAAAEISGSLGYRTPNN